MKWVRNIVTLLLILVVVAGVITRLSAPDLPHPPGELVDIGGFRLHINAAGKRNKKPTLVIESGGGSTSEFYHWLSEGLADSMRVVRYDRAGIAYSDPSHTPRDPETVAQELHNLLEKAGESPPYIMAGHSLGGPYIRVFTELYPEEVVGMLLLDATHHDRPRVITSIPSKNSRKFKTMIFLNRLQEIVADAGILLLYDKLMGPIMGREMEGIPDYINDRVGLFLQNGNYLRAMNKESALYHDILERAGQVTNFGDLPLRVFAAADKRDIPEKVYQRYLKKGIDLRDSKQKSWLLQKDLVNLSSNSKFIEINGNHNTMYTKKENAEVICQEVLLLLSEFN